MIGFLDYLAIGLREKRKRWGNGAFFILKHFFPGEFKSICIFLGMRKLKVMYYWNGHRLVVIFFFLIMYLYERTVYYGGVLCLLRFYILFSLDLISIV